MKKFASLLMAVLMMCTILTAMAIPAFAEGEPTVVEPDEYGDIILGVYSGDFIINEDCTVGMFDVGENVTLTIAPNAKVTVTDVFSNFGTLNVLGQLNVTSAYSKTNSGTINVGCGGTIEGTISGTVNKGAHHYVNSVCEYCNAPCPHTNTEIETVTTTTKTCKDCEKVLDKHTTTTSTHTSTASTLSEGNLAIITAVAGIAVGLVGGLVIGKKKKVKSEA